MASPGGRASLDKKGLRRWGQGRRFWDCYVTRLTKLAFVSPTFLESIAAGKVPAAISLQMVMDGRIALPIGWEGQEKLFAD